MSERHETVAIKKYLDYDTAKKRIYGCDEVTIGFFNGGGGDERVDYMTMDSRGVLRCYEIKVTMGDLKSSAKKSFYGHYNYLVVTDSLYREIRDARIDLAGYGVPEWAGVIRMGIPDGCDSEPWLYSKISVRKCVKCDVPDERADMLKGSLVRTLYWKMEKYRKISDGSEARRLRKEASEWKRKYEDEHGRMKDIENTVFDIRNRIWEKYGIKIRIRPSTAAVEFMEMLEVLIKHGMR